VRTRSQRSAAPLANLVLLDVRLPGMDGFDVLRRLEAGSLSLPVILVTSFEDELDQLVGYPLGAIDYVVSPSRRCSPRRSGRSRIASPPARRALFAPQHRVRRSAGVDTRVEARRIGNRDVSLDRHSRALSMPRTMYPPSSVISESTVMSTPVVRCTSSVTRAISRTLVVSIRATSSAICTSPVVVFTAARPTPSPRAWVSAALT
jgi:CheY-like chemotaxis protein